MLAALEVLFLGQYVSGMEKFRLSLNASQLSSMMETTFLDNLLIESERDGFC